MKRGRPAKIEGEKVLLYIPVKVETHRALSHLGYVLREADNVAGVMRLAVRDFVDASEHFDSTTLQNIGERALISSKDYRRLQTVFPVDVVRQLTTISAKPELGERIPKVNHLARVAIEDFIELQNINPEFLTTTSEDFLRVKSQ